MRRIVRNQLKSIGRAFTRFMVHRPQPSAGSPALTAKQRYGAKSSLYPYLPASEEQRDWLEQLYSD